jgi:hypothetical protein
LTNFDIIDGRQAAAGAAIARAFVQRKSNLLGKPDSSTLGSACVLQ